ncbi:hypothetical protein CL620_06295 [archaeon]|nr:hypothetical protein [archaeon]|tara:strand:- start:321 stop:578 length:258 start_codon:yes stop_codon:yes gene_type:complete
MTDFGWNYPPGVTGNEYAISGDEGSWEEDLECKLCEKNTLHSCEVYRSIVSTMCMECHDANDYDSDWWFGVGDMAYDVVKDGDGV